MKLLANENFPLKSMHFLQEKGKEFEPIFPGDYLYTLFISKLYTFENQFTVIDELRNG